LFGSLTVFSGEWKEEEALLVTACCQNCRACCQFELGCINLAWLLVDLDSASKAATSAHMPNVIGYSLKTSQLTISLIFDI